MSYEKLKLWVLAFLASIVVMAAMPAPAADQQPEGKKYTADQITGAIVVFEKGQPEYVIFVFNDGQVFPMLAENCVDDEVCAKELKALMDAKRVLPLEADMTDSPDTTT